MTDDPAYKAAKRDVEALKGFYVHALVYVCVMSALVGLNFVLSKSGWWVQWPLLGWGAGLLCHGIAVYLPIRLFSDDWTERKIQERLSKR